MNSDVMHRRVQMEPAILEKLMTEVRETVATDVVFEKETKRGFGALNMYKIRRRGRFATRPRNKVTITNGISC